MSKFCITEDVAPVFEKDLENFRNATGAALERLLASDDPSEGAAAMEESARHAHTLKGLAAMVGATALSRWGEDLERLWEVAPTFLHSSREKAEPIARFVLAQIPTAWAQMNRLVLAGENEAALAVYTPLRAQMLESWGEYLAVEEPQEELEANGNGLTDAAMPVEVVPPTLKKRKASAETPAGLTLAPLPDRPATNPPAAFTAIAARPEVLPPTLLRKEPAAGAARLPVAAPEPDGAAEDLLAILKEEVAAYLLELAPLVETLSRDPSAVGAWDTARRLFHTIKGAAATVGVESIAAAAKRGEARCLVAMEDARDRDFESVSVCAGRAGEIAAGLGLPFSVELAPAPEPVVAAVIEEEPLPDSEMLEFFTAEAAEQAESIEAAVLLWERGENSAEHIATLRRGFHTIKGAANSIGLRRLGNSVHHAEELAESAAEGRVAPTAELFAFLLRGSDEIRSYVRALAAGQPARWEQDWAPVISMLFTAAAPGSAISEVQPGAAPVETETRAAVSAQSAEDTEQLLRVEMPRLRRLLSLAGEMVTDRSRLRNNIERLTDFQTMLRERNLTLASTVADFQQQFEFNLLRDQAAGAGPVRGVIAGGAGGVGVLQGAPGEFSELEFDRYDQFSIFSRTLVEMAHDIDQVLAEMQESVERFGVDNAQFTQTSKLLQGEITGLSLVPVSSLYPRLTRTFRDAVHDMGIRADLVFEGAAVQVDKAVTDKIHAPLLHLLRNSVAHGIEAPERRIALGKPERGLVRMRTTQVSNQIIINLSDDGAGLNIPAIRSRAIERGLLPANAPLPTVAEAVNLIFLHGFSTAVSVTSVAGRGVGLDVVREEIEKLNGSIDYLSAEGQGAEWIIRLPLSISISEATLIEAGGIRFALPLNFVESGLILNGATTRGAKGEELYQHGSELIPVLRLREVLRLPGESAAATCAVIVAAGGRRAVVFVERVLARQEVVVKELDSLMRGHPLITGATLNTEGGVIPILNVPALLSYNESAAAHSPRIVRRSGPAARSGEGALRVLIADDSLSVRKVQTRMLAGLGCEVTAANDGLDAIERLRAGRFDLVFTDLEMPRVNGYELIAEIRANPPWASLPTIVISSRGADKYINKAMTLGATTFLSKPFTEEQLAAVLAHYAGWDSATGRRQLAAAVA